MRNAINLFLFLKTAKTAVLYVSMQIENVPQLICRRSYCHMHEDDKKLARALRRRLSTNKLAGIVYSILILSLSLGVSFIFYSTAAGMGGIFYAFLIFIPIILSFTLVAVYYKLKLTWRKSSALYIVTFFGAAFLLIFLAYYISA